MKKKLLALMMAVVMVTMTLAACGGGGSASGSVAGTAGSTGGQAASGQTITVWIPPYTSSDAELNDQKFWDGQFDAFEQENNCTVRVEIIPWDGYNQKIATGVASGDGPDVIYTATPYDLAESGALEPLEKYFSDEEIANFLYWDLGKVNGTQYIAPMLVGNAHVLYCNMDLLNAAGVTEIPQTWEEFIDACLKIKETGVQPFLQGWGDTGKGIINTAFYPYYWQTGGELLDENGHADIDNEYGLKTINFLYSLMETGIFDETITAATDLKTQFREGKLAMYVGDTGSSSKHTEAGINWDFTPALTGTDGVQATWIAADSLAIASNSDNKELAVAAMKYMLSAPVMDAFHEKMYAMCPITKDAKFYDDERFQEMYIDQAEIFHVSPAFKSSDAFTEALRQNVQSMYMGDMTPEQVLKNTMEQYEAALG